MITSIHVSCADDNFSAELELDDLNYPLQKFTWQPEMDGAEIGRMQAPGRHSWRKDLRHMPLDIEGEILADTTTSYWTKRKALMQKFVPAYANVEYDPIKIRLVVDGDAENYYAFFVLESMVPPLEATGAPTVSDFQIGLSCRFGYWRKASDDTAVRI